MGLSRQDYWSGLPYPPPGDLPDSGIEPASPKSPAPAGGFFTRESLNWLSNSTCETLWNAETSRLPRWLSGKESACQCWRRGFHPRVGKVPWRRKWQPTPVFLPGKSHGEGSLEGHSPWGHEELDMTEQLNTQDNTGGNTTLANFAQFERLKSFLFLWN